MKEEGFQGVTSAVPLETKVSTSMYNESEINH